MVNRKDRRNSGRYYPDIINPIEDTYCHIRELWNNWHDWRDGLRDGKYRDYTKFKILFYGWNTSCNYYYEINQLILKRNAKIKKLLRRRKQMKRRQRWQ